MKTFAEVNTRLRRYWPDKLERQAYTTEHMVQLMDFLGNPQEKLKVIHVAGTSGKTSTAYYAAALLKAAGKRVGLTVSPHVDEINERVQLNLQPLPEARFCAELEEFLKIITRSHITPTYFELLVAFAFWEFARQGMEYAVIEVGMGGLADATNVIQRSDKVCVITDIGLDHVSVLGKTLADVATHKAGIIQLHNSVCCYQQAPAVMRPIQRMAQQKQADLHVLSEDAAQHELADLPLFQQRNLGLARTAVGLALERHDEAPLTKAMVAAAARVHIPARMEMVQMKGKTVVIDGAHNAQKLHALAQSLRQRFPSQPIAGLVSLVGGRDYRLEEATKEMAGMLDYAIVTAFSSQADGPHPSVDPAVVAKALVRHGLAATEIIPDAEVALAVLLKRPEQIVVVTGSFYLLNHVRPHLV